MLMIWRISKVFRNVYGQSISSQSINFLFLHIPGYFFINLSDPNRHKFLFQLFYNYLSPFSFIKQSLILWQISFSVVTQFKRWTALMIMTADQQTAWSHSPFLFSSSRIRFCITQYKIFLNEVINYLEPKKCKISKCFPPKYFISSKVLSHNIYKYLSRLTEVWLSD